MKKPAPKSARPEGALALAGKAWGRALLLGYADTLFLGDARLGVAVCALTFVHPNAGACALVAGVTALLFGAWAVPGTTPATLRLAMVNVLLVGVVFGTTVQLDAASGTLLVALALGTVCLTLALQSLGTVLGVSVFSLPFSVLSVLLTALLPRSANFYLLRPEFHGAAEESSRWVTGMDAVAGMGNLFGSYDARVGLVVLALLGWRSRFSLVAAGVGLGVGAWIESVRGVSATSASHFPLAYNEALAAVAIGSVFLVPSLRAFFFAALGAALTVVYGDALRALTGDASVYTFPFLLGVGTVLGTLRFLGARDFAERPDLPAEKNLERQLSIVQRFQLHRVHLGAPLSGKWKVSQGTHAGLTHQAPWTEAIDFLAVDGADRSYKSNGGVLTDYYAFDRPVFSPVTGYVVGVVGNRPDQLAGTVDTEFPWGNHLVIRTLDGLHVVLAHLRKDSPAVVLGQYVPEGTLVGAVGNSGYSPQPHLHLHVQREAWIGSPTVPFRFVAYEEAGRVCFSQLPTAEATVEFANPDPQWEPRLTFVLDDELVFESEAGGEKLRVAMEPGTGIFRFVDERGNALHFSKSRHYFCTFRYEGRRGSFLEKFAAALPRVPLAAHPGTFWQDTPPLSVTHARATLVLAYLRASLGFAPRARTADLRLMEAGWTIAGKTVFHGQSTAVELRFGLSGITELRFGPTTYRRRLPGEAVADRPAVGHTTAHAR